MKTAIRTPIVEAIRSVIQGGGGGPVSPVPLFYWKGQYSLAATTGTDPTFTRATAATFEDFEGVIRTVESSEPRFQGARRVENLLSYSEDFTNAAWTNQNIGVVSGITDPDGGSGAFSLTANAAASQIYESKTVSGASKLYRVSVWIKRISGSGDVKLKNTLGADTIVAITSEWKRYTVPATAAFGGGGTIYSGVGVVTSGDVVGVWHPQTEEVTGQTNQNPSEYVSTGVGTGPELVTNGDFAIGTLMDG